MATDIGAFIKHLSKRLAAFEERQGEFDEAISSLTMAIRARPTERQETPICMVRDPDRDKYEQFSLSIDSCLAKGKIPPGIHWRTLWLHLCKKAVMVGDGDLLDSLIALYHVLTEGVECSKALEGLAMVIE